MKRATIVSAIFFALFLFSAARGYAEEDHLCRSRCIGTGGTLGYCSSLCSEMSGTGARTNETDCFASCVNDGNVNDYCNSYCGSMGGTRDVPTSQPYGRERPEE